MSSPAPKMVTTLPRSTIFSSQARRCLAASLPPIAQAARLIEVAKVAMAWSHGRTHVRSNRSALCKGSRRRPRRGASPRALRSSHPRCPAHVHGPAAGHPATEPCEQSRRRADQGPDKGRHPRPAGSSGARSQPLAAFRSVRPRLFSRSSTAIVVSITRSGVRLMESIPSRTRNSAISG